MGRNRKYGNLILTNENRTELEKLANSQTAQYRKVQRAKIILMSADGMHNSDIAVTMGVHRNTVATFLNKYLAAGQDYAINDSARSGKPSLISDEEKVWITSIACTKPKEIGYAQELWIYRKLRDYVQEHSAEAGYPGLTKISVATIHGILVSNDTNHIE